MIEHRQLQFLLQGENRKLYEQFLKKSCEYKDRIRQLAVDQMNQAASIIPAGMKVKVIAWPKL